MLFSLAPYLFAAFGVALITAAGVAVWWCRREDRRQREWLALALGLRVSGLRRTDGQGSSDHSLSGHGNAVERHVVSLELERARRRRARRNGLGGAA